MGLMSWLSGGRATGDASSPAVVDAPRPMGRDRVDVSRLAPVQRSVTAQDLVIDPGGFQAALTTRRETALGTPLGHLVSPDAPAGLVRGVALAAPGSPAPAVQRAAEMPLRMPGRPAPVPVQRHYGEDAPSLTSAGVPRPWPVFPYGNWSASSRSYSRWNASSTRRWARNREGRLCPVRLRCSAPSAPRRCGRLGVRRGSGRRCPVCRRPRSAGPIVRLPRNYPRSGSRWFNGTRPRTRRWTIRPFRRTAGHLPLRRCRSRPSRPSRPSLSPRCSVMPPRSVWCPAEIRAGRAWWPRPPRTAPSPSSAPRRIRLPPPYLRSPPYRRPQSAPRRPFSASARCPSAPPALRTMPVHRPRRPCSARPRAVAGCSGCHQSPAARPCP